MKRSVLSFFALCGFLLTFSTASHAQTTRVLRLHLSPTGEFLAEGSIEVVRISQIGPVSSPTFLVIVRTVPIASRRWACKVAANNIETAKAWSDAFASASKVVCRGTRDDGAVDGYAISILSNPDVLHISRTP